MKHGIAGDCVFTKRQFEVRSCQIYRTMVPPAHVPQYPAAIDVTPSISARAQRFLSLNEKDRVARYYQVITADIGGVPSTTGSRGSEKYERPLKEKLTSNRIFA